MKRVPVLLWAGLLAMAAEPSRADTWATASPMPTRRSALAAVSSNDGSKIYALGGSGISGILSTAEIYDASAGTWRPASTMLSAREDLAAATGRDGTIYALGGKDASGTPLGTVEAYDPSSAAWRFVASMPTARSALAAAVGRDGTIYALGGRATATFPSARWRPTIRPPIHGLPSLRCPPHGGTWPR